MWITCRFSGKLLVLIGFYANFASKFYNGQSLGYKGYCMRRCFASEDDRIPLKVRVLYHFLFKRNVICLMVGETLLSIPLCSRKRIEDNEYRKTSDTNLQ